MQSYRTGEYNIGKSVENKARKPGTGNPEVALVTGIVTVFVVVQL